MHLVCHCIQYGELVRKDNSRPDEASIDQKSSIQEVALCTLLGPPRML